MYRLPQNVLRAIWLLAHSLIGIRTSRLVVGSSTVTTRLIPASRKTSLMASLYFCSEMKGRMVALPEDSYLFRIFFAIVTRGTDMVLGLSSFVLPLYNQKHPLPHSTRSYDISHLYDNQHNIEIRIYLFERLMQDDLKSQNPQSGAVPLPLYRQEFHTPVPGTTKPQKWSL